MQVIKRQYSFTALYFISFIGNIGIYQKLAVTGSRKYTRPHPKSEVNHPTEVGRTFAKFPTYHFSIAVEKHEIWKILQRSSHSMPHQSFAFY